MIVLLQLLHSDVVHIDLVEHLTSSEDTRELLSAQLDGPDLLTDEYEKNMALKIWDPHFRVKSQVSQLSSQVLQDQVGPYLLQPIFLVSLQRILILGS